MTRWLICWLCWVHKYLMLTNFWLVWKNIKYFLQLKKTLFPLLKDFISAVDQWVADSIMGVDRCKGIYYIYLLVQTSWLSVLVGPLHLSTWRSQVETEAAAGASVRARLAEEQDQSGPAWRYWKITTAVGNIIGRPSVGQKRSGEIFTEIFWPQTKGCKLLS